MVSKVTDFIEKNNLIQKGCTILVGVSGGADSVCLLYILKSLEKKYDLKLYAVHVNHMIRSGEAERDEEFTKDLCGKLNVPCIIRNIDVPCIAKEKHLSTEEAGRIERYRIFEEVADKVGAGVVALAHNMDDDAETILLNLCRGAGMKGMSGIPIKRGKIIRPLLCCMRDEIEQYLLEKKIDFCVDSTNKEDEYTRNKIRNVVLPYMQENINKETKKHIISASKSIKEAGDFLDEEAKKTYERYVENNVLKKEAFSLHKALLGRVVRMMIADCGMGLKDITRAHVEAVEDLTQKEVSKEAHLPKGIVAKRTYEGIMIKKDVVDKKNGLNANIQKENLIKTKVIDVGPKEMPFAFKEEKYTKWVDYDKISEFKVRTRRPGDYLVIDDFGARKKLQDYMVNEKIPRDERDGVLLIADKSHIVWVVGHRISAYYKVTKDTKRVLEMTYKENGCDSK